MRIAFNDMGNGSSWRAVRATVLAGLVAATMAGTARGQSTSIRTQYPRSEGDDSREALGVAGDPVLESSSLIAVATPPPKTFKPGDYLTIIVRERILYEAEGETNARRQADLISELEAFINFKDGGVGATTFARGMPNIDYRSTFNQRNNADAEREDSLTTRITAKIIDVKPNGNLIFEARKRIRHDDNLHDLRLTGGCRSVDVTADNSVLSTQINDLGIDIKTKGGVRDATHPGWLGTVWDWIRPL